MGANPPPRPRPRVIVYIDGFNLYYGAVKATPRLKWLDLAKLCRILRPADDIQRIHYSLAMLDDAYQGLCDHQILVSGDSDLVPAIAMVRHRFPVMKTTVYVPSTNPIRGAAVELRASAHVNRDLPLNLLPHSQFPNRLPDGAGGFLNRPAAWV